MQTFLPVADFTQSARYLDSKRLGKQRSETMIIYNTLTGWYQQSGLRGWPHHPATKMWTGCEGALLRYGIAICQEWQSRGYEGDNTLDWFQTRWEVMQVALPQNAGKMPVWLGSEPFHASHRSNLLRKDPEHYRQYWPNEQDNLPYVWPV